jgi:hypothetical protein
LVMLWRHTKESLNLSDPYWLAIALHIWLD